MSSTDTPDQGQTSLPEVLEPTSPYSKPNRCMNFVQSCLVPPRVCLTCCIQPCARVTNGKKRPTWSFPLQAAISTMRSAVRSIPRDPHHLRFWADHKVPDVVLPPGAVRSKSQLDHIVVEWVWPRSFVSEMQIGKRSRKTRDKLTKERIIDWSEKRPVVLFLHGGAYIVGSSGSHRGIIYSLAIQGDVLVVAPNYRRVPDVSVPQVVDDCCRTFKYLVDEIGVSPSRIALVGDSAGGALCILTTCRLREENRVLPSCLVLMSPWVELDDRDIEAETRSMPEYDVLPYDAIREVAFEIAKDIPIKDPRINPMYTNLCNFPPTLVHAGEVEVLRPQIERFVEKARSAGVDVTYETLQDMVHVGHMFLKFSEIASDAIARIGQFVSSHSS